MGEPLPGDIPDPTHIKTQNVQLGTNQKASKGDWLVYNDGNDSWNASLLNNSRIVSQKEAVQLQEDIDTTDIVNQAASAAVFANGSWVYALVAGKILPNSPVHLVVFDSNPLGSSVFKIGFITTFNADIASIDETSGVVTITTAEEHGYKVGDVAVIFGADNNANNGTFIVEAVNSTTVFVINNATGVDQTGAGGTSSNQAERNGGVAKFIKRSGDTFAQEGSINEIGVFALTGLGL